MDDRRVGACGVRLRPAQRVFMSGAGNGDGSRSRGHLLTSLSRVVFRIDVLNTERTVCGHLRHVLSGLCPMKVGSIAWQYDDATGRIRLQFIGFELLTDTDVENA